MYISFLHVASAILETADEDIPKQTRWGLFLNVLPMPSPPIAYDVTQQPPDVIIRADHQECLYHTTLFNSVQHIIIGWKIILL